LQKKKARLKRLVDEQALDIGNLPEAAGDGFDVLNSAVDAFAGSQVGLRATTFAFMANQRSNPAGPRDLHPLPFRIDNHVCHFPRLGETQ
jgi:hypothetical protein